MSSTIKYKSTWMYASCMGNDVYGSIETDRACYSSDGVSLWIVNSESRHPHSDNGFIMLINTPSVFVWWYVQTS